MHGLEDRVRNQSFGDRCIQSYDPNFMHTIVHETYKLYYDYALDNKPKLYSIESEYLNFLDEFSRLRPDANIEPIVITEYDTNRPTLLSNWADKINQGLKISVKILGMIQEQFSII